MSSTNLLYARQGTHRVYLRTPALPIDIWPKDIDGVTLTDC